MHSVSSPLVFPNLANIAKSPDLRWEPFRPGIEIARLFGTPGGGASAFLRYSPGARLERHMHRGWEQILILSGSQTDDTGHYQAGAMIVHPPGSAHAVSSDEGCIVLAIWEKPVTFASEIEPQPIMSSAR
jgi:anti-sigma factor ChrR (cupin superfamily)